MPCSESKQSFRFLDLPGEIRNNIYDLLLCSWDDDLEQDATFGKLSRRSLSNASTALLRANRQIHAEASDYMIQRNQFVRITCRGFDVRDLFLGDKIPVISTDARRVSLFGGYVAHMTLSNPAYSSSVFQFSEFEMMMLRLDLPKLCSQLDLETVMTDANQTTSEHTSIRAAIRLSYAYTRHFTREYQRRLLEPITTWLRGVPDLKTFGRIDGALAESIKTEIAKPRWTDAEATIEEIGTGIDVGKRQWQQGNFYSASASWAYALRTLERMRHSSSWPGLQRVGGEEFVNKVADLYFTLNLLHAQFLEVDMLTDEDCFKQDAHGSMPRNGRRALAHLSKCELAAARFAQHTNATWRPSNAQSAKMLFRHARCLRLMRDDATCAKAVALIEEALALAPNDVAVVREKDLVSLWEHGLEQHRGAAVVRVEGESRGVWEIVVDTVVELVS